jgi:hypothetical protein
MRNAVPAGVLDAGFAAMATFVIAIYAAREFDPTLLGYYSVFFTAFLTAVQVPGKLLMVPTEIHALTLPQEERMPLLVKSLLRGLTVSTVAGVAGALVGLAITVAGGFDDPLPFVLTLALAGMVSPLQDHIRRMLHAAERSWSAAVVSMVQAGVVAVALGAFVVLGVDPLWIPFSALAIANVFSSATGILMSRRGSAPLASELPTIRLQLQSGRWLLATGLLAPVGGLVVQSIVLVLADASVLGLAEAARVVGRPITVVSTGLGQALAPRSIAAAQQLDRAKAKKVSWVFHGVFVLGGLLYTGIVAFDWWLNIARDVVPAAYAVSGLVLATCLANVLVGLGFPNRYELLGGGREPWVTAVEVAGQGGRTVAALAVSGIGSFVIPLGDAILGLIRVSGYKVKVREIYTGREGQEGRR